MSIMRIIYKIFLLLLLSSVLLGGEKIAYIQSIKGDVRIYSKNKLKPPVVAIIGRYILSKQIINQIMKLKPGQGGEIHITDSIRKLIKENYRFVGHNFAGKYLDCGSMNGYIKSSLEISKL